jgi:hypothetical protein
MEWMPIELPVVVEGAFDKQGVYVHRSTKYTESDEQSSQLVSKFSVSANFECMRIVHCLKHNREHSRREQGMSLRNERTKLGRYKRVERAGAE